VRAVGQSRASELVLLGDAFGADQALAWGIGGTIVEPDDVLARAQQLAQRWRRDQRRPTRSRSRCFAAAPSSTVGDALAAESAAQHRLGLTSDHQGAVNAFLPSRSRSSTAADAGAPQTVTELHRDYARLTEHKGRMRP